AAAPVRDAMLLTEGIQPVASGNAEPGLERAARIIDAGMDDLAVARAGAGAETVGRFEDENFTAGLRQRSRHRQAHDASADDDRVDVVHAHEFREYSRRTRRNA